MILTALQKAKKEKLSRKKVGLRNYQKNKTINNIRKYWQLYLLLLPAIIYFIVFRYAPMSGIQIAFRNYIPTRGFFGSEWVGLKHFIRFFSSPDFMMVLKNTLFISFLTYNLLLSFYSN